MPYSDEVRMRYGSLSLVIVNKKSWKIPHDYRRFGLDEYAAPDELVQTIDDQMNQVLIYKDNQVMRNRWGLDDGRLKSQKEAGRRFILTGSRVGQIEFRALRKLRYHTRRNKIKEYMPAELFS